MHRWWDGDSSEQFWVEISDRKDFGTDLNAPEANELGQQQWSYDLLREPSEGDVVYHFDKNAAGFVAFSFVVGDAWRDEVVWGARGTSARDHDVAPYARPGWRRGLRGFSRFPTVTLTQARALQFEILQLRHDLEQIHGSPLYFPFTPYGESGPIRTTQGYFLKLPADLVTLLKLPVPSLAGSAAVDDRPDPTSDTPVGSLGATYRRADESVAVSTAEPMQRDPAIIERGLKSHRATQNSLADWASDRGWSPLSPSSGDPDWDVAWSDGETLHVAEVKSITPKNEERQLRLAVGQVLRYRQRLVKAGASNVQAVIATSASPIDNTWQALCAGLQIKLTWPGAFDSLESSTSSE